MEIKTQFKVSYADGIEFIGYRHGNYKSRIKNIKHLKKYNQFEFKDLFRDFSNSGALIVIANKKMDWMNDFWIESNGKWYVDFPLKDGWDTKFQINTIMINDTFFTHLGLSGYRYFNFSLYVDSTIWNQKSEDERNFLITKGADNSILGQNGLFLKFLGKESETEPDFGIEHRLFSIDIENFKVLN